ncbi:B3 domain-containing protein, partial [Dichanthelium oligosanthes]
LKHFAGKLSGTIKLESPHGSLYDIEVAERFNKVVLRHGWEAFVDAHDIEENDFLLFRHTEKSCFEILILDSDGCEKVFPCTGIENIPCFKERSVDSVDISSSSHHETTESSESESFTRCAKGSSCHCRKSVKMAATSSSSEESGDIPSESESFELDDLQAPLGADYILPHRSYLSEAQEERVVALIRETQHKVTAFVAIMRKSHVQGPSAFLVIPKEYAFAHFPHETTNITLRMPGKSKKWHPKFHRRKDLRVYMLRGQWLDFVRDNHVKVGDICLLFPTKGARKFTFTVHLLRTTAARSMIGTGFRSVSSCRGTSSPKMASVVHIKEEPTDEEYVSSESDIHGISNKYLENEDPGGSFEPPYIMSFKSFLSQSQKKIVEEKEISSRYATGNLPDRRQTMVLHYMGKSWETQIVIRSGRRWFLCGGWSEFVCDNGLRVGDLCLFELEKNESKLTMTVHIIFREQL